MDAESGNTKAAPWFAFVNACNFLLGGATLATTEEIAKIAMYFAIGAFNVVGIWQIFRKTNTKKDDERQEHDTRGETDHGDF